MGKKKRKINPQLLLESLAALENGTKTASVDFTRTMSPTIFAQDNFLSGLQRHKEFARRLFNKYRPDWQGVQFRQLVLHLNKNYPKLMWGHNVQAMICMSLSEWVRPLEEWRPRGKSQEKMLRSLAAHLHCKYPTPQFLFRWFEPNNGYTFSRGMETMSYNPQIKGIGLNLFFYLAHGGSMRKAKEKGHLNVPMTKKMAHIFVNTKAKYSIVEAIRRSQVTGMGYDDNTYQKIIAIADYTDQIGTAEVEAFRGDFIQWLGIHPMLAREQVSPLFDYIKHRRFEDNAFVLTGRSPLALLQGMNEWHAEQFRGYYDWSNQNRVFEPSGLAASTWTTVQKLKNGAEYDQVWGIQELLSDKELRKEGRAMHHCVGSYGHSIKQGTCSIWSLRYLDSLDAAKRIATIEVRAGKVVQVRGVCNALIQKSHMSVINKWASKNNLTVSRYV